MMHDSNLPDNLADDIAELVAEKLASGIWRATLHIAGVVIACKAIEWVWHALVGY